MMTINTAAVTGWENPQSIESHAETLRSAAGDFHSAAEDAKQSWAGLGSAYRGDRQEILWSALDDVVAEAGDAQTASTSAADALDTFAQDLQALRARRSALFTDIGAFSRDHGTEADGELDDDAQQEKDALVARVDTLASDYQLVVQTCVSRLNALGAKAPRQSLFNGVNAGQEFRNAIPGAMVGAATWGSTTLSHVGVTTFSQRVFAVDRAGTVTPTFQPRASALTAATATGSRFTLFGSAPGRGFFAHQRQQMGQQLTNLRSSPLTGIYPDARTMTRSAARNFGAALPVLGETLAFRDGQTSRRTTTTATTAANGAGRTDNIRQATTTTSPTTGSRVANVAIRGTGTLGTVVSAGMTYSNQKDHYLERNAQENPGMSTEELRSESTHDAAADTVGQTGATVLTAAAAGAAVGSVVPVAGTAVGAVVGVGVGVVAGVATNMNFLPDVNGDGTKDSVASAAGHLAKEGWSKVRNVFGGD